MMVVSPRTARAALVQELCVLALSPLCSSARAQNLLITDYRVQVSTAR